MDGEPLMDGDLFDPHSQLAPAWSGGSTGVDAQDTLPMEAASPPTSPRFQRSDTMESLELRIAALQLPGCMEAGRLLGEQGSERSTVGFHNVWLLRLRLQEPNPATWMRKRSSELAVQGKRPKHPQQH